MLSLCETKGAYDALILPRSAKHNLVADCEVGALSGIVSVSKGNDGGGGDSVAEHLLHRLLGLDNATCAAATHADARAGLWGFAGVQPYQRMLMEARFAAAFTLRGYEAKPAYDGVPLVLCVSPHVAGTAHAAAAIKRITTALSGTDGSE